MDYILLVAILVSFVLTMSVLPLWIRKAKSVVMKRLKLAESLLNNDSTDFYAEISRAIYQFVGDKLNQSEHGLTPDELKDLLQSNGITDELWDEINTVLQEADFGRFAKSSSSSSSRRELLDKTEKLILRLGEKL